MTIPGNSAITLSIVTPVFDPPRDAFIKCIESVLGQTYPHWEWCLVDDCSSDPWVWKYLQRLAKKHENIRVRRRSSNGGISLATNDAIDMATSAYLAFLDHDDALHVDALSAVNHVLHHDPSIDLVYTDEDKIGTNGEHFEPFAKPEWSPERLLAQNYCSHLSVIRTSIVRKLGGLRQGYEGAQDHDLLLRLSDEPLKVAHIKRVLYHWRSVAGSHASQPKAKAYTEDAKHRAIADACSRRGFDAELIPTPQGYFRVRRKPKLRPKTSVIIPTRGTMGSIWGLEAPYVENLLLSATRTDYPDVEYVVVYDTGTDPELLRRISGMPVDVRLVEFEGRFNFSKKCNLGALESNGDRLIFLNDDIELITPEWIGRMIAFLEEDDIGAVGPMLLYENGLIQSAGHINPGPVHFANGMSPSASIGAAWPLSINREVSGVTGACLAMRREVFFDIGGFSEIFAESFNDVDLGFKLLSQGFRIIWTPDVQMYHFESRSRSPEVKSDEVSNLRQLWGRFVDGDKTDDYTTL